MDTQNPVPDPDAHGISRYDTDPDALAWARTRVQHQIDRLAAFEARAAETGKANLAHGLSMARRSTEQLLLGGEGCVVGAFDERRPVMFGGAAPAPAASDEAGAAPTITQYGFRLRDSTLLEFDTRAQPPLLRRPWQRFRMLDTNPPIQGHGYTPAGLLGMDIEPEPDEAALTPPADQPDGDTT